MGKTRGKFINVSEEWELNDWLDRNGYRETEANRTELIELVQVVKDSNGKKSSDNLSWEELDAYHKENTEVFDGLEKKQSK